MRRDYAEALRVVMKINMASNRVRERPYKRWIHWDKDCTRMSDANDLNVGKRAS